MTALTDLFFEWEASEPTISRVYTDAGVFKPGLSGEGFTWAYCYVSDDDTLIRQECGVVLPADLGMNATENNLAETYAALMALQNLPDGAQVTFYLDNANALRRLTTTTTWNGVPDPVREGIACHLKRLGTIECVLLGGHPTAAELATGVRAKDGKPVSKWNVECDRLCNEAKKGSFSPASLMGQTKVVSVTFPPALRLSEPLTAPVLDEPEEEGEDPATVVAQLREEVYQLRLELARREVGARDSDVQYWKSRALNQEAQARNDNLITYRLALEFYARAHYPKMTEDGLVIGGIDIVEDGGERAMVALMAVHANIQQTKASA